MSYANGGHERRWALVNWGLLRSVHRTRRDAKREAEESSGEPWSVCQRYFTVERCTVQKERK